MAKAISEIRGEGRAYHNAYLLRTKLDLPRGWPRAIRRSVVGDTDAPQARKRAPTTH
jgi:uncharacterized protein (DUF934 family)